jgi:hypothetical protein
MVSSLFTSHFDSWCLLDFFLLLFVGDLGPVYTMDHAVKPCQLFPWSDFRKKNTNFGHLIS